MLCYAMLWKLLGRAVRDPSTVWPLWATPISDPSTFEPLLNTITYYVTAVLQNHHNRHRQ